MSGSSPPLQRGLSPLASPVPKKSQLWIRGSIADEPLEDEAERQTIPDCGAANVAKRTFQSLPRDVLAHPFPDKQRASRAIAASRSELCLEILGVEVDRYEPHVWRQRTQVAPQARLLHVEHRCLIDLKEAHRVSARDSVRPGVQAGTQGNDGLHACRDGLTNYIIEVGHTAKKPAPNPGHLPLSQPQQGLPDEPRRHHRNQGAENRSTEGLGQGIVEKTLLFRCVALEGSQRCDAEGGLCGLSSFERQVMFKWLRLARTRASGEPRAAI